MGDVCDRARLDAWQRTTKQLSRRYSQLRERVGKVGSCQVDTAGSFYPSKAEQCAEQKLRKSDPQLAQSLDLAIRRSPTSALVPLPGFALSSGLAKITLAQKDSDRIH
jgi:hypothetical protein